MLNKHACNKLACKTAATAPKLRRDHCIEFYYRNTFSETIPRKVPAYFKLSKNQRNTT